MIILEEIKKLFQKKRLANYPWVPQCIDLRYRIDQKKIKQMSVLNVGVGVGDSGIARQLPFLNFKRLDNIDVFEQYLIHAKQRTYVAKTVTFTKCDIREFKFFSYDLILAFDVLEHLPKEDSLAILKKIKCQQLIFIPLEKEYRPNVYEAESQDHLSLWTEEDFKKLGYQTELLTGFHHEGGNTFDALWAWKDKEEVPVHNCSAYHDPVMPVQFGLFKEEMYIS